MAEENELAQYFTAAGIKTLEFIFLLCLPFIAVSVMCGVIVNARNYVLEKEKNENMD